MKDKSWQVSVIIVTLIIAWFYGVRLGVQKEFAALDNSIFAFEFSLLV